MESIATLVSALMVSRVATAKSILMNVWVTYVRTEVYVSMESTCTDVNLGWAGIKLAASTTKVVCLPLNFNLAFIVIKG